MKTPLVSFIIPYYNAGATIQETIDSIFNQTYPNYDIWLINDGSTDPLSIEKLKEFEGVKKIHLIHQENLGPSSARNNAIQNSESDYVIFLDSDDLIEKETLIFSIENIGDNDVLFGDCHYFGKKNSLKKQELPSKEQILLNNPIAVCALVRLSTLKNTLFDEELNKLGLEDWELWIHLFSKDCTFLYFNKVLFYIRVIDNSRTFQVANKNIKIAKNYIFKKHSNFLYEQYKSVYYEKKEIVSNIDFRIGKLLFYPYRIIKGLIKIK